jgi:hypothetical protein
MNCFITRPWIAIFLVMAGCTTSVIGAPPAWQNSKPPEGFKPGNVFISTPVLPAELKRVLVLPLACEPADGDLSDGCKMLNSILRAELIKAGRFEVVSADSETLSRCTGRLGWTGAEALPDNFFGTLKRVYGCDAVLFCQLTVFRANAPLAIGWRLKLADAQTHKILWAADEVFDAADSAVAKNAQEFQKHEQPSRKISINLFDVLSFCTGADTPSALNDQWTILHSPRYFGRYSLETLLQTLPQR